jgi:hypothetical protein
MSTQNSLQSVWALLYPLYTADLQTSATSAHNIAAVATDSDPAIASQKLQIDLAEIQNWLQNGEYVKYLRLHLDRRITWCKHIFAKRKQLGINITIMY